MKETKDCKVTFTFTNHKYRKSGNLCWFEARKNIPEVNYGKQPTARTNGDACSQEYSVITFLILKKPLWKEKGLQQFFWRTRKTQSIFKNVSQKNKNFKAIWAVLGHSKPKILSVGQPWWLIFFRDFVPPTILVMLPF